MEFNVSGENLLKEQQIIDKLKTNCDSNVSTTFNAGAGAGKTYALVQCLKHIIITHRDELIRNNQKVCCITYTNVAADNIKQKIGNSDIVNISTIHERIWDMISNQQVALVEIHRKKLEYELEKIENELQNNEVYSRMSSDVQEIFEENVCEHKDDYYKWCSLPAKEFREHIKSIVPSEAMFLCSNVTRFKKIVNKIFRRNNYNACIQKITSKKNKPLQYTSLYSKDRLHNMTISHDTLLEYADSLVQQYPLMCQMIIDKYPYILIDEYQDTNEHVVKIMDALQRHTNKIKHPLTIMYFGDSAQNIYDTGVGEKLEEIHQGLAHVNKEFNRRSYPEIIEVANKIRNDDLEQQTIYTDICGGSIEFYEATEDSISDFINDSVSIMKSQGSVETLHCLMLKNKTVAKYNNIENLYIALEKTPYYEQHYDNLGTELLNRDLNKLGEIELIIYKLMRLYVLSRQSQCLIKEILPKQKAFLTNITMLRHYINMLTDVEPSNLQEWIKHICDKCNDKRDDKLYVNLIEYIFGHIENNDYYKGATYYMAHLLKYQLAQNENLEEQLSSLLQIEIEELCRWYGFITDTSEADIYYQTVHSTKGLEYENVVIILEAGTGKSNPKCFEDFFKDYGTIPTEFSPQVLKARNLLYVGVTRAIKNLRILYTGEITSNMRDNM